jgi:thiosulfate reductase cytochrome b subunit
LKKLWHRSRLNFVVTTVFFIVMTGTLFSGLRISQSVLSTLGIHLNVSQSWKSIHFLLSDAAVIMLGVHFALHLKWVGTNINRYILNPIRGLFQRRALPPVLTAQPVRVEKSK